MLDAIRAGDADTAARLAREHVRNAAAHWLVPPTPDHSTRNEGSP
jgi:DNA-binding GntR family transcriptional regulator